MNNHGIICKNNTMIIFLCILLIIILILLNKKVKFNIDLSIIGFEYNYCISVNYFIDLITLYKEDLGKYKKQRPKMKDNKWFLKYINVERVNFDIRLGLDDVFVTSMIIPIVSTIIPIFLQIYLPKATKRFSIKPIYNKLFFDFKGAAYVSIKLKDLIYVALKIMKTQKENKQMKVSLANN